MNTEHKMMYAMYGEFMKWKTRNFDPIKFYTFCDDATEMIAFEFQWKKNDQKQTKK